MAVAAAQKNREMFAIKKSYSIEVSIKVFIVIWIMNLIREQCEKLFQKLFPLQHPEQSLLLVRYREIPPYLFIYFPSNGVSTFPKAHLECTFFVDNPHPANSEKQ